MPYYLKSIFDVNIGAFPLLPNQNSGLLLKSFIDKIINRENQFEQIKYSIPQKGLSYNSPIDIVLVGFYKSDKDFQIIKKEKDLLYQSRFRKRGQLLYYCAIFCGDMCIFAYIIWQI